MTSFVFSRVCLYVVPSVLIGITHTSLYGTEQVIPAHPRASLEIQETSEQEEPTNFILSSVQRIRHEVTFERTIKVFGIVSSNTYQMPADLRRSDVVDWFKQQITPLDGDIKFECEERDCGRATIWASNIFKERVLTTSDINQQYLAVVLNRDDIQHLVMIYVVERNNRRVYAHVVDIVPNERITIDAPIDVSSELSRYGIARIPNVVPDSEGSITSEGLEELQKLAQNELQEFTDDEIYVVCHVNGPQSAEELLELSKICAEQVIEIFEESGLNVVPFGMGPLSPIERTAVSRIELVIPRLLRREIE